MNYMKPVKLLCYLCLLISLQGCAQTQHNTKEKKEMDQNIKNKYLSIYTSVKKYNYNPAFYLDYSSYNCTYEILVNDMPALVDFNEGNVGGAFVACSNNILCSGKQSITIRMYPKMNANGQMDKFLLPNNCGLEVKLVHGEIGKQRPDEYKPLFHYKMPPVTTDALPYLEYKAEFTAETPYQLTGWSQSQDLAKEDTDQLLKEVLQAYQDLHAILERRDVNAYAARLYRKELEIATANFFTQPSDAEDLWNELEKTTDIKKMLPLEHYQLKLFGNGRVVALIRTDDQFKGECALIGETDRSYRIFDVYLHKPAGSKQLEVIR